MVSGMNRSPTIFRAKGLFRLAEEEKREEFGALEWTRTTDPQLRKLMLYPLSYEREKQNYTPKSFAARHHDAPNERFLSQEKQDHQRHAHQRRRRHNQVPLIIVLTLIEP